MIESASEVIQYVKDHGLEIRFSCEDSFRSDPSDLLRIYEAVDKIGVDRVGIADTVGVATPFQVYNTIKMVREVISPETGTALPLKCETCTVSRPLPHRRAVAWGLASRCDLRVTTIAIARLCFNLYLLSCNYGNPRMVNHASCCNTQGLNSTPTTTRGVASPTH